MNPLGSGGGLWPIHLRRRFIGDGMSFLQTFGVNLSYTTHYQSSLPIADVFGWLSIRLLDQFPLTKQSNLIWP
jgi:hypothetical protein